MNWPHSGKATGRAPDESGRQVVRGRQPGGGVPCPGRSKFDDLFIYIDKTLLGVTTDLVLKVMPLHYALEKFR